jgi:methylated-DNA-[protein]-cysteine S-methyltransferase
MPKYAYLFPIGKLWIEEHEGKIISLGCQESELKELETKETDVIRLVKKELDEYFARQRTSFTFPISLGGSEFYKQVWEQMLTIPYGKTMTYGAIAQALNTKGARAVGRACGSNKLMIVVPCHRVIGTKGKLTGFFGGLDLKTRLLDLENNHDFKRENQ